MVAVGLMPDGSPVLPLETVVLVCHRDRCVRGTVRDTGLIPPGDLDLSPALFEQLAPLSQGRIEVNWTVLKGGTP